MSQRELALAMSVHKKYEIREQIIFTFVMKTNVDLTFVNQTLVPKQICNGIYKPLHFPY